MSRTTTGIDIVLRMRDRASRGVQVALRRVNRAVERTRRLVFSLGGALAGLGVALTAKSFLDTAAMFERFSLQLETTLGSAQKAEAAMGWIRDFAQTTPYELAGITEAFVRLKAYGLDPMDGTLRTVGDTAAAFGRDILQAADALAAAVAGENERLKAFGIVGKVVGEEMVYTWTDNFGRIRRTVAERTPEIIRETILAIWNEKYAGGMQRFNASWTGMWSNLQDTLTEWKQAVMTSGPFQALKAGLSGVLADLRRFEKNGSLQRWAVNTAEFVIDAFAAMASAAEGLRKTINVAMGSYGVLKREMYQTLAAGVQTGLDFLIARINTLEHPSVFNLTQQLRTRLGLNADEIATLKARRTEVEREIAGYVEQVEKWDKWTAGKAADYVAGSPMSAALDRLADLRGRLMSAGTSPGADATGGADTSGAPGAPTPHNAAAQLQPGADAVQPGQQIDDFVEAARAQAEGYVDVWRTAENERLAAAVRADEQIAAARAAGLEAVGALSAQYLDGQRETARAQVDTWVAAGVEREAAHLWLTQRLAEIDIQAHKQRFEAATTFYDALGARVQMWADQHQVTMQTVADLTVTTMGTMVSRFGDAMSQAIVYGANWAESMQRAWKAVAAQIISSIVQTTLQYVVNSILQAKAAAAVFVTKSAQNVSLAATTAGATYAWMGPGAAAMAAATAAAVSGAGTAAYTAAFGGFGALAGVAHGGLDYVPREGTYLIDQGERIVAPRQNRRLERLLDDHEAGRLGSAPREAAAGPLVVRLELDGRRLGEAVVDLTRQGVAVSGRQTLALVGA